MIFFLISTPLQRCGVPVTDRFNRFQRFILRIPSAVALQSAKGRFQMMLLLADNIRCEHPSRRLSGEP